MIQEKTQEEIKAIDVLQNSNSPSRAKEIAFNKLFLRHHKGVGFFLKKRLKDVDVIEDLTMITFQKAYANILKYKSNHAFSTWLYSIAKNNYIDYLRGKESKKSKANISISTNEDDEDSLTPQFESNFLNPEEDMIKVERIAIIQKAIYKIKSKKIREIMICRFIEDLSLEEISEKLNMENNSTLRINIKRGKEMIKNNILKLR